MGKSIQEVLSWPVSIIVEWQAHFALQAEDRQRVDEVDVEEKLKQVLKPRQQHD